MHKINNLPAVASMEGVLLFPHTDPAQARIEVSYIGQNSEWHVLSMPLLDGLYLLNLLEAMSEKSNLGHLRKPPAAAH